MLVEIYMLWGKRRVGGDYTPYHFECVPHVSLPASLGRYMHCFLTFKIVNGTATLLGEQNNIQENGFE